MALDLASFIMFLALALRLKSLALDYVSLTPTLMYSVVNIASNNTFT